MHAAEHAIHPACALAIAILVSGTVCAPEVIPALQTLQAWQWAAAIVASRTMYYPPGGDAGAMPVSFQVEHIPMMI